MEEKKGNVQNGEEEDGQSEEEETDDSDEFVEIIVKENLKEKWDCESVLSTYSNLENHPSLIEESVNKIKLSKKTHLPLGILHAKTKVAKERYSLTH